MLPADQRLHGHDLVRAQGDLGLEVQHQLVTIGGSTQRVLDHGPPHGAGLHGLIEEVDRAATALVGHLAGGLGLAEELFGPDLAGWGSRHADRGGEEHLDTGGGERGLEGGEDSGAQPRCVGFAEARVAHEDELVAAPAREGVGRAAEAVEPFGHQAQEHVADLTTEAVVLLLEAIDAHEQDGH